jgi:hypothetical protein
MDRPRKFLKGRRPPCLGYSRRELWPSLADEVIGGAVTAALLALLAGL